LANATFDVGHVHNFEYDVSKPRRAGNINARLPSLTSGRPTSEKKQFRNRQTMPTSKVCGD